MRNRSARVYVVLRKMTSEAAMTDRKDLPPKRSAHCKRPRRGARKARAGPAPELGGRDGPEAVRYGDWEKKGIAIDF